MSETDPSRRRRACPICGKPEDAAHRPFCSKRCALLDLGRWLGGDYRLPTNETPEDAPPQEDDG